MASPNAENALDEAALQRELSCPLCYELFSVPIILKCNHTFCKKCLEVDFKKRIEGADKSKGDGDSPPKMTCPTCEKEVTVESKCFNGFPKDYLLVRIIENYKASCSRDGKKVKHKEEVVWCSVCEKEPRKAVKTCTVCKLSYCDKCLTVFHPNNRGGFASHQMVTATNDPVPGLISCPMHEGEQLKLFCSSCRTPICYLCDRFGGHQSHSVAELKTVSQQEKEFLMTGAQGLAEKNQALHDFTKQLEEIIEKIEDGGKDMEAKVKKEFAELHKAVDAAEKRAFKEILINTAAKVCPLRDQKKACLKLLDENSGTVQLIRQAAEIQDIEPFLLRTAYLRDRLSTGSNKYGPNCQNPVKNESSDPMNLNTRTITSNLDTFNLGYLTALQFNFNSDTAHPNLLIDQEHWKTVELIAVPLATVTLSCRISGAFEGPCFAVLGSTYFNYSYGRLFWECSVLEKENLEDVDANYTISMATHAYRHQRLESQSSYPICSMSLTKRNKKYKYAYSYDGNITKIIEKKKASLV
ncbi:probable E3 ubiquitin-protein ligase MID2 [Ptychodera flava]|uniref:probable E3 ubiquitin-protein ligase MID2 n=1 Tax=Ptychodera flava TaxID=63121 RepID=UPI00396A3706